MDLTTLRRYRASKIRAFITGLSLTDAMRFYRQGWGLRRTARQFGIGHCSQSIQID
jgi:hypothetical protein